MANYPKPVEVTTTLEHEKQYVVGEETGPHGEGVGAILVLVDGVQVMFTNNTAVLFPWHMVTAVRYA